MNKGAYIYSHILYLHICFIARGVAQLVAYFVRDEGVASSSLVTPTKKTRNHHDFPFFVSILFWWGM